MSLGQNILYQLTAERPDQKKDTQRIIWKPYLYCTMADISRTFSYKRVIHFCTCTYFRMYKIVYKIWQFVLYVHVHFCVYTTTQLLLYTFVHVHILCTLQLNNSNTLLYMYIFSCTLQSNNSNTVLYIGWYRPWYVHSTNSSNKTTVAVNMNNHSISLNMCCKIYYL